MTTYDLWDKYVKAEERVNFLDYGIQDGLNYQNYFEFIMKKRKKINSYALCFFNILETINEN